MTTLPVNEQHNPYLHPPGQAALNPWFIRLPLLFISGGILLVLILVSLVGLFQLTYTDRITPGVWVGGIDVSGMTHDEAVTALSGRFTYGETAAITLYDNSAVWEMTAGELGVAFDVEATVNQALAAGKATNPVTNLVDQLLIWFNGESVAPIIRYDQNIALANLESMAGSINREAQDATLTFNGSAVATTPGQSGRTVDVAATLAQLDNAIMSLSTSASIPLVIHETPPQVWNADEAVNQINAALSSPLELFADAPDGQRLGPWTATVDQIASLLSVELVDNRYQASVDIGAFELFLNELAPGLLALPRDGRFHFNDNTGQLEIIQPAVNGRTLNVAETLARLEQAIFRYDNRSVPMAFDYTLPRYHNGVTAAELGITQMVAEATTVYTGSTANRRHNIAHGASLFDGVIIGPGEEFSFNYLLGELSEETGFVESKVIVGERTVDGIGGGICQVSTTAFRAAFTGGFPIIERNQHAYRVGFYELNAPPGLDAAIWTPDRDMRFQNDTPYHLLVETSFYPANNSLQFRFYSTNPGRSVEIQQPIIKNHVPALEAAYEANNDLSPGQVLQVDWAAEGADVTVYRTIRDANGNELTSDYIYTHYLPWRAVYQVAPGDSRLNSS